MRCRQQVEHGIGGAPHGHDHANGVLERLTGHQVPGCDPLGDGLHQHLGRGGGAVRFLEVFRRHGAAERQAHAHGLKGGGHGVGGEHAPATACPGAGFLLHRQQLGIRDVARCVLTHRLEGADHGEILASVAAGLDGSPVHKDRGNVEAGHGDHGAGHVLVTASDGQETVHALSVAGGLDAVGNHLP